MSKKSVVIVNQRDCQNYYEIDAAMNVSYDVGYVDNRTELGRLGQFYQAYAVLTQRPMRTPVNELLTWLAVSDVMTMVSYIPFATHFYISYPSTGGRLPERNSRAWMTFLVAHVNLTSTTHTISIWMCVTLAIVRYLHITSPTKTNIFRVRRIRQTRIMTALVYISSTVVLIPNYLSNELHKRSYKNQTVYYLADLGLGRPGTETTVLINVWLYAMVAKLVPCLLMSIFSGLLIYNIHVKVRHRRKVLQISGNSSIRLSEHSRTTKMLIAVITLFIVTELPQGILIVCSATIHNFFDRVYQSLGDVMDIVALVNNSINFVLYCSMSAKFRQTFVKLYCGRFKRQHTTVPDSIPLPEKRLHHIDSESNIAMLLPK
ncbi:DMSR1-like protein [Mya arenaria]|uniref:DMSR1-like protein n=1 Tax=Mya arenaria TaxID=6604 RepID=A0ABY7F1T0_MYAAR|nr:DMSR1-like protein [Mya arenaria]